MWFTGNGYRSYLIIHRSEVNQNGRTPGRWYVGSMKHPEEDLILYVQPKDGPAVSGGTAWQVDADDLRNEDGAT